MIETIGWIATYIALGLLIIFMISIWVSLGAYEKRRDETPRSLGGRKD